jgi:hypothetical protein
LIIVLKRLPVVGVVCGAKLRVIVGNVFIQFVMAGLICAIEGKSSDSSGIKPFFNIHISFSAVLAFVFADILHRKTQSVFIPYGVYYYMFMHAFAKQGLSRLLVAQGTLGVIGK